MVVVNQLSDFYKCLIVWPPINESNDLQRWSCLNAKRPHSSGWLAYVRFKLNLINQKI